jgi:hypothetical protein
MKIGAQRGVRPVLFEEMCRLCRNGGEERKFGGGVDDTRVERAR